MLKILHNKWREERLEFLEAGEFEDFKTSLEKRMSARQARAKSAKKRKYRFPEEVELLKPDISKKSTMIAFDIDCIYGNRENKTLLQMACSMLNRACYVEILLKYGADANKINSQTGKAPIHLAILYSDYDTVKLLTEYEDTKIHLLDNEGKTSFQLAAKQKRKDFIELLQKRQVRDIDQGKRKFWKNECILPRYEEEYLWGTGRRQLEYGRSLAALLFQNKYEEFASKANSSNVRNVDKDLELTYLQFACNYGRIKFVQLLLDLNVDPNEKTEYLEQKPVTLAAQSGYPDIVRLLMNTGIISYEPDFGRSILQSTLLGFYNEVRSKCVHQTENSNNQNQARQDYPECVKLILNNVPDGQLNVNLKDSKGNTALFYAVVLDRRDIILQLLERGAYIGVQASFRSTTPLIKLIQPSTLEYLLDCSTTIDRLDEIEFRLRCSTLTFDYTLLAYERKYLNREQINETKLLVAMSKVPELRPLLKHPFFLIYLDLKWHVMMKQFYYINLIFFCLFVFLLSLYIFGVDYAGLGSKSISCTYTDKLWSVVLLGNLFMLCREIIQFLLYEKTAKFSYFKNIQNLIEIILIVTMFFILFDETESYPLKVYLEATAIFASYTELTMLIMSDSRRTIAIEMLRKVSWSSFKLLLFYFLIIEAFALSFYIILKNSNSNSDSSINSDFNSTSASHSISNSTSDSNNNVFNNPFQATFKTLLMSTGEYELSGILNNDPYGINHLVFLLFVFLIPVVLFNLLNAIAVSDIQAIKNDAEMISIIAQVKRIAHIEKGISKFFSLLGRLIDYYNVLVRRQSRTKQQNSILEMQYYFTNYFSILYEYNRIFYRNCESKARAQRVTGKFVDAYSGVSFIYSGKKELRVPRLENLKLPISSFTQQSIQEKLSARTTKKERVDPDDTTATIASETSTLQEICENLKTLKNELEETNKKYELISRGILALSTEIRQKHQPTSSKEIGN